MLLGSMSAWADTLFVRVLSGLGVLLLTAAQPKALSWHQSPPDQHDPLTQKPTGDGTTPLSPGERKPPKPLTLAATLPQTMSPRSPVGTVSEAERQARDGRLRGPLVCGADDSAIAAIVAELHATYRTQSKLEAVAVVSAAESADPHALLCVISPMGPPGA